MVYGPAKEKWGLLPFLLPRSGRQSCECCRQLKATAARTIHCPPPHAATPATDAIVHFPDFEASHGCLSTDIQRDAGALG